MFLLKWPITFLLWLSVPDCRKHPKMTMLTFLLCIVWIGLISYVVAILITIIGMQKLHRIIYYLHNDSNSMKIMKPFNFSSKSGDTANVPDSVMGLTFLAAGTSLPEAVSSVIVTNQGHGAMGISSSISSNTFDILLCLGIPWFLKSYFVPDVPGQNWVRFFC